MWRVQNFREVSIRKTQFTNKIYVKQTLASTFTPFSETVFKLVYI